MSDSQVQASQPQVISRANPEEYETIRHLISNHGNSFLAVTTFCACLFAFPVLTFFLTLHEVYEGDFNQARFAALKVAALVVAFYGLGFYLNKRSKKADRKQESKKDQ